LQVAVGTLNPIKIAAVRDVLNCICGKVTNGKVTMTSIAVESGVPTQPIGLNQTLNGAINRAKKAIEKYYGRI